MDVYKFINANIKICKSHTKCRECPLSRINNGHDINCEDLLQNYPDEYVAIVEEWVKEPPIKTNLMHYAKELRELGYYVDEKRLGWSCPIPYSSLYGWTGEYKCNHDGCTECRKWWDAEYIPGKGGDKG